VKYFDRQDAFLYQGAGSISMLTKSLPHKRPSCLQQLQHHGIAEHFHTLWFFQLPLASLTLTTPTYSPASLPHMLPNPLPPCPWVSTPASGSPIATASTAALYCSHPPPPTRHVNMHNPVSPLTVVAPWQLQPVRRQRAAVHPPPAHTPSQGCCWPHPTQTEC
jgi:hypothetical protein